MKNGWQILQYLPANMEINIPLFCKKEKISITT